MITAEEDRKFSESYDEGILEKLENKIKDATNRGERSVYVDSDADTYIDKLEEMGYEIIKWMTQYESGYTISW